MTRYLVNPLFVFLAVWGCATGFYVAGLHAGLFPSAEPFALGLVLLNVATFSLGYLTWSAFLRLRSEDREGGLSSGVALTPARLRLALRVTLAFGATAFLLCAARLVLVASAYHVGLLTLLSDPVLWRGKLTAYIAATVQQTTLGSIAISITSSIFSIGFVLLGICLYFGRSRRRYFYVLSFLLLLIGISLLNLSRKEVTVNVLFLVFSYLFMHHLYRVRTAAEVVRTLVIPFAAVVFLYVVIELLLAKGATYGRSGPVAGFLFSLYWYTASPLAALAEFLADRDEVYALGQSLFLPVYKWLYRFHLVPPSTVALFGEKVYIPYVANVYSYLRNIYEDFGVFGVAVVPYVLGWGICAAQHGARVLFGWLNLYLILLALLIFSFYSYLLISNQYYLQAAFALVFFRFRLTDLDKAGL